MKKIVLILVGGLLLSSCGSDTNESTDGTGETETTGSGDIVNDKIVELILDVEKGMKPLSPIADVSKYDSEVKAYVVGENETGNFNSQWEDGDFEGSRFYSKKYNDDSQLGEVRLSIWVKQDVIYDSETGEEDESKKIDYDKYLNIISDEVGGQPTKENHTGGGHVWKTSTANWYLSTYDDYSLEFKMKEAK